MDEYYKQLIIETLAKQYYNEKQDHERLKQRCEELQKLLDIANKDLAAMAVEVGKVCQCEDGCSCGGAD